MLTVLISAGDVFSETLNDTQKGKLPSRVALKGSEDMRLCGCFSVKKIESLCPIMFCSAARADVSITICAA